MNSGKKMLELKTHTHTHVEHTQLQFTSTTNTKFFPFRLQSCFKMFILVLQDSDGVLDII